MKIRSRATPPAAFALGVELHQARMRAKFGLRELANRVGVSPGNISHGEAGTRRPSPDMTSYLLGLFKVAGPEYKRLRELASNVHNSTHVEYRVTQTNRMTHLYERMAISVEEWAPAFLPLRLQTRAYTWEMAEHTAPPGDSAEAHLFELTDEPAPDDRTTPPTHVVLIHERTLSNPVIGPETLIGQHHQLLGMPSQKKLTIQIVPSGQPDLPAFTIYRPADQRPTVALRHAHTIVFLTSDEAVAEYTATFKQLSTQALSRDETHAFVADQLQTLAAATA